MRVKVYFISAASSHTEKFHVSSISVDLAFNNCPSITQTNSSNIDIIIF